MNVMLFGPELYYLGLALVFFCLSLRSAPRVKTDYRIALGLAAVGLLLTASCLFQQGYLFFNAYRVDLFSQIFKFALALGLFLVLTISHNLAGIEERQRAEFYLFLTTTIIGMMLLVSAVELLTIYVALESPPIPSTSWCPCAGGTASTWRRASSTCSSARSLRASCSSG